MENKIYELTVGAGEDVKQAVTKYVLEKKWDNVYIMGGIGSMIDVAVTNPVENRLPLKTALTLVPLSFCL